MVPWLSLTEEYQRHSVTINQLNGCLDIVVSRAPKEPYLHGVFADWFYAGHIAPT